MSGSNEVRSEVFSLYTSLVYQFAVDHMEFYFTFSTGITILGGFEWAFCPKKTPAELDKYKFGSIDALSHIKRVDR